MVVWEEDEEDCQHIDTIKNEVDRYVNDEGKLIIVYIVSCLDCGYEWKEEEEA